MSFLGPFHRDFIKSLNDEAVEFLIVGGQAAIFYGVRRSTGDMDVLVKPTLENGERILKAFHAMNLQVDDLRPMEFQNTLFLSLGFEPDAVDILTVTPGIDFDVAFQRSVKVNDDEVALHIVSLDDLIKNKESLNREGEKKTLDDYDVQVLRRLARST